MSGLQCMFDLMFLALQTDSTRVITYSIGNMRAGGSMASGFPAAITGEEGIHHKFAHGNRTGKYDAFLASQKSGLTRFQQKSFLEFRYSGAAPTSALQTAIF